jgi:hypothetical protein
MKSICNSYYANFKEARIVIGPSGFHNTDFYELEAVTVDTQDTQALLQEAENICTKFGLNRHYYKINLTVPYKGNTQNEW